MRAILAAVLMLLPMGVLADEPEKPKFEMTTYYVALLYREPKWTAETTPEVMEIQKGHMAHIGKMAEAGKLILAGPFSDGGNLRGMFIFKTETMEEAKALGEADPAVKSGRLVLEWHPWFSAKGIHIDPH